jgi:isoquinoline 1-oxidoreductase beta subunit
VIFALSATLGERITFSEGRVQQRSFAEYPVLPITKAPEIRIEILDDPTLDPGGVGELAGPTVAPALANALSRLGHGRLRSLPMVAGS